MKRIVVIIYQYIAIFLTITKPSKNKYKMTKQCTICGEQGEEINWHYGAISCIACRKFFYRSETEPRDQYTCSGNVQNKCKITVENRAKCKLCRFLKCLSSGMNLVCKQLFIFFK